MIRNPIYTFHNSIFFWGGARSDAKLGEKCPRSHDNKTDLIKQISKFDTAMIMKNI